MWLQYNEEVDYYADNTATWTDTEQRLPGGNPVYGWSFVCEKLFLNKRDNPSTVTKQS